MHADEKRSNAVHSMPAGFATAPDRAENRFIVARGDRGDNAFRARYFRNSISLTMKPSRRIIWMLLRVQWRRRDPIFSRT
ncbi:hypothetical protein [Bradyrhizobium sp. LTSPM299]|uniref:hypothetical protein n=1 Tax=Bradyrhizobium sp. LTSPM299 TaxID=1619233 RepID=UPI0012E318B9|nr:hypothetical protein [Bradyrhizobium sp. LTSPM299]